MEKKLDLIFQEIIRRINRSDDRLRVLEQRARTMESRISTIEESILKENKDTKDRILNLDTKLKALNDKLTKIENDINKINDNLKSCAKRNEIKEIEEMFSLLNPIKNEFVTRKEMMEMLQRR